MPPRPRPLSPHLRELPPLPLNEPTHIINVAILKQRGERLQGALRAEVEGVLREGSVSRCAE